MLILPFFFLFSQLYLSWSSSTINWYNRCLPDDEWKYIIGRTIIFVIEQKGIVLLYEEGWYPSCTGNDAHVGAISKRLWSSTSIRFGSIFASTPHITWWYIHALYITTNKIWKKYIRLIVEYDKVRVNRDILNLCQLR